MCNLVEFFQKLSTGKLVIVYVVPMLLVGVLMGGVTYRQNVSYDGGPYFYGAVIKNKHHERVVYLETPPFIFSYLGWFIEADKFLTPDYKPEKYRLVNHSMGKHIFDDNTEFQRQNIEIFVQESRNAKLGMLLYSLLGFVGFALLLNALCGYRLISYLVFLLYITQPLVLSLSNLIMVDLPIISTYVFALYFLVLFYRKDNLLLVILLGLIGGVLLVIKFTGLPMFIGIVLSVLLRPNCWYRRLLYFLILCLLPLFCIYASYDFYGGSYAYEDLLISTREIFSPLIAPLVSGCLAWSFLPEAYLAGMLEFINHYFAGHKAFLLGETYRSGCWYFFPICFVLKMTCIATLLILYAIIFFAINLITKKWQSSWKKNAKIFFMPFILGVLAMNASVNDGVRNAVWLLAILMLTLLFTYQYLLPQKRRWYLAVLMVGVFYNITLLGLFYPWYIPFVEPIFGGPKMGKIYMSGSDVDMGENLYALEDYLREQKVKRVISFYIGSAVPKDEKNVKWMGPVALRGYISPQDRIVLSESSQAYERKTYDYIYRSFEKVATIGYNMNVFRPYQPIIGGE